MMHICTVDKAPGLFVGEQSVSSSQYLPEITQDMQSTAFELMEAVNVTEEGVPEYITNAAT